MNTRATSIECHSPWHRSRLLGGSSRRSELTWANCSRILPDGVAVRSWASRVVGRSRLRRVGPTCSMIRPSLGAGDLDLVMVLTLRPDRQE